MDNKITIIEGPPPIFEGVDDGWALGINESTELYDLVLTRLRTFNGPALVERCHSTWNKQATMYLHYRDTLGLEERAPIMAARSVESKDGQVLLIWVRLKPKNEAEDIESEDDPDADTDFNTRS